MNKYPADWDDCVDRLAAAMRTKLAMHVGKGDWRDVGVAAVLTKLNGEIRELHDAVASGNVVEVLLEAADVAVCAMIIADLHLGTPRPIELAETLAKLRIVDGGRDAASK